MPGLLLGVVDGGSLERRVLRLLDTRLPWARRWRVVSAAACVAMLTVICMGGAMLGVSAMEMQRGIPTGGKLKFEVASVKLEKTRSSMDRNVDLQADDVFVPDGGRFVSAGVPVFADIAFAYKLTRAQTDVLRKQLPSWALLPTTYDIEARSEGNPTKDQYREMMRALLAERFGLHTHVETREVPVYALVVAKPGQMGPQLKAHGGDVPCAGDVKFTPAPNPATVATVAGGLPLGCGGVRRVAFLRGHVDLGGRAVTMDQITSGIYSWLYGMNELSRPLVNETGLDGTYDFTFQFAVQTTPGSAPVDDPAPEFPEAVTKELGLKLKSTKAPEEFLVVDHIERPSEN